jgi:hypothetical protein
MINGRDLEGGGGGLFQVVSLYEENHRKTQHNSRP